MIHVVDKNLFLYDLAVVAIFKNEAPYLKEWLNYHLLAGVEHFYLYNNDSSDNYKEVLAPYVEKNLVTLTEWSGKLMMYPAYNDAIDKYRFDCRYMAFIDLDEFVYPKGKLGGVLLRSLTKFYLAFQMRRLLELIGKYLAQMVKVKRITLADYLKDSLAALKVIGHLIKVETCSEKLSTIRDLFNIVLILTLLIILKGNMP